MSYDEYRADRPSLASQHGRVGDLGRGSPSTSILQSPASSCESSDDPTQGSGARLGVNATTTQGNVLIDLTVPKAVSNQKRCLYSNCRSKNRIRVPQDVRDLVLVQHRFYIPEGARCCQQYLNSLGSGEIPPIESLTFTAKQIEDMIDSLRHIAERVSHNFFNFEFPEDMLESKVIHWTGLTKNHFNDLATYIPNLEVRLPHTALALYLAKLRTGDTDEHLSDIFNVPLSTVQRMLTKVRDKLGATFVPRQLGPRAWGRAELRGGATPVAEGLFCDREQVITIWDGTYVYMQKSSNYCVQRKSFSMHKHRPLIKPFLGVLPNGKIMDVFGPFEANLSDGKILESLLQNDRNLRAIFQENDVFLVDRGFRDAIPYLTGQGFDVHMPALISQGSKQLNWEDANRTRFVTKVRYAIEVVNGELKRRFRIFDHVWYNTRISHAMADFRIAAALCNAYLIELQSDIGETESIVESMKSLLNKPNHLSNLVAERNLNRRSGSFARIELVDLDFPRLEQSDFYTLALGSYQIKQARSYYAEHISNNGRVLIWVCRHVGPLSLGSYGITASDPMLIKAQIRSRFRNSTKYATYILLDRDKIGLVAIVEYCCQCKNGLRTVGCCAHIMTIVWFLGWARHQPSILFPAQKLDDLFLPAPSDSEDSQ